MSVRFLLDFDAKDLIPVAQGGFVEMFFRDVFGVASFPVSQEKGSALHVKVIIFSAILGIGHKCPHFW